MKAPQRPAGAGGGALAGGCCGELGEEFSSREEARSRRAASPQAHAGPTPGKYSVKLKITTKFTTQNNCRIANAACKNVKETMKHAKSTAQNNGKRNNEACVQ